MIFSPRTRETGIDIVPHIWVYDLENKYYSCVCLIKIYLLVEKREELSIFMNETLCKPYEKLHKNK